MEALKLEALKQINLNAAGLDIGDDEIYVAVPEDRDMVSVKVFKTFTADLYRLAEEIRAMRDLVRQRRTLTDSSTREIQHMQKALPQMNLKLTNVISDVTGKTGQKIVRTR